MSEKPAASIKTLARYEPATVYIGTGEYVAECVRADDGDYYLAEDVDAALEAARAEVEAWRELSDHVRVGACNAIWPDRYIDERIRDVAAALKRAERLREALEDIRSRSSIDLVMRSDQFALTAMLGDIHQIAGAALAKENSND